MRELIKDNTRRKKALNETIFSDLATILLHIVTKNSNNKNNNDSISYVLGIVISAFHVLTHLVLTVT